MYISLMCRKKIYKKRIDPKNTEQPASAALFICRFSFLTKMSNSNIMLTGTLRKEKGESLWIFSL